MAVCVREKDLEVSKRHVYRVFVCVCVRAKVNLCTCEWFQRDFQTPDTFGQNEFFRVKTKSDNF